MQYGRVDVLGAFVPLSLWTVLVLAVGTAASLLTAPALAARYGWGPGGTVGMLLAITVMLALTVTPGGEEQRPGLGACIPQGPDEVGAMLAHFGGGMESLLNVVLLVPVGAFAVAASRRPLPGAPVVIGLPVFVEAWQTIMPGRMCDPSDVLANILGGLAGMVAGAAYTRHHVRAP